MKHIINRNGIRLSYTNYFINKGKPDFIEYLDWNVIESDLMPDENFLKSLWNGSGWVEGATQEEIIEANKPIIPEIVSRRQFKIALAVLGYEENNILNGINQLPEPNKTIARISYTESGTFERNSDDLNFVAKTFLSLTDEQIDEVFLTAITF